MDSGKEKSYRYLTAKQDEEGVNLRNVKRWKREGIVVDYKLEGDRLLVYLKDPDQIAEVKKILGVRGYTHSNRGSGRKPRGGGRVRSEQRGY